MKKILPQFIPYLASVAILAIVFLCLVSAGCELFGGNSDDEKPLAGSWTLETTPTAGIDLGDGTFVVAYTETQIISGATIHSYGGTASLLGIPFTVGMIQEVNNSGDDAVLITIEEVANELNSLSFFQATVNSAGDLITGNMYSGWNEYEDEMGTFSAYK